MSASGVVIPFRPRAKALPQDCGARPARSPGQEDAGMIFRDRCVGRFQRRIRWAVCGWLIFPNWDDLQTEEEAQP
jgi:hypothetical protein